MGLRPNPGRAFQAADESLGVKRLHNVVRSAERDGLRWAQEMGVTGDQDNRKGFIQGPQPGKQFHAVHLRHLNVGDHNIDVARLAHHRESVLTRTRNKWNVPAPPDQFGAHLRHRIVVLHDQDFERKSMSLRWQSSFQQENTENTGEVSGPAVTNRHSVGAFGTSV